ncbi:MAG: AMP-binding protein [Nitriliruptorales bacterium]
MSEAEEASRPAMPDPSRLPRPWVSTYPPGVPPTYDIPAVVVPRFLDDAARDFPDVPAIIEGGDDLTYVEMRDRSDRLASSLAELGLGPGRRLALALPNTRAAPLALFAALRAGAAVALADPAIGPEAVADLVERTKSEIVLVEPGSSVRGHLSPSSRVVVDDLSDSRGLRGRIAFGRAGRDDATSLRELIEAASGPARTASVSPSEAAVVLLDESGEPVVLSHANLVANAFQARLWIPDVRAGRERVLFLSSIASGHGLTVGLLASVLAAATIVLDARGTRGRIPRSARRTHPTVLHPSARDPDAVLTRWRARSRSLASVRAGLADGVLGPTVSDRLTAASRGGRIRGTACFTAAVSLTHANPVYGRAQQDVAGVPVTSTTAAIVDPGDPTRVLPVGEAGMVAVHGPQVADPDLQISAAVRDRLRDGWLVTGRFGSVDDEGVLTLADDREELR